MCDIDAIILASGSSSRMGQNKLLRLLDDKRNITVLDALLSEIPYQLFNTVIIVVSDNRVQKLAEKYPVQIVFNGKFQEGKSQSIIQGVKHSRSNNGVMFFVADQPLLMKRTIIKIVEKFVTDPEKVVVPVAGRSHKNPVCFPVELKSSLLELQADQGGKMIINHFMEKVTTVEFKDSQEFYDVDTDEAFCKVKTIFGKYK